MKNINDIRQKIAPAIQEVEQFRKEKLSSSNNRMFLFLIPILLAIYAIYKCVFSPTLFTIIPMFLLVAIPLAFIYDFAINNHKIDYYIKYKEVIFTAFVKAVYPNAQYISDKKVRFYDFRKAKFFDDYNVYYGEDYISGKTEDGKSFEFSELKVSKENKKRQMSKAKPVFQGLFFVLETEDHLSSEVHILHKGIRNKMTKSGKLEQRSFGDLFHGSNIAHIHEHQGFEDEFTIYSKTPEEAYRVLSPAMIDAIYNLHYKWNADIYVSFVEKKMFIAISTSKDYFQPEEIDKIAVNKTLLQDLYDELATCFSVIEAMSNISKIPIDYNPSENWEKSQYEVLKELPQNRFM